MTDKLDDLAIEGAVRSFLDTALGSPGDDIDTLRERNLRFYNAEPVGELAPPDIADRSDFVATDVADTVEWMLPQLIRLFVSSDNAVEFEARRPESAPLAKLATEYVNWLFYTRNDGQEILYDWFKDALLQKVGFLKIWAEEESEDERRTLDGVTQDQVAMMLEDGWEAQDAAQYDDGTLSVTLTKDGRYVCIKAAAVPPAEMRVDINAQWGGEPAAMAHVYQRRRFELEQDGFDLSDVSFDGFRDDYGELGEAMQASGEMHESHRPVEVAETYIKLDRDGDGVAEWLKVETIAGQLAIRDGKPSIEQVDDHPFVWICPIPRPHAFFGDCPADLAILPQKLRTDTIRVLQDNLYLTVNQRTYVNQNADVQIEDLIESRPGGIVRGSGPMSDAIAQIVQPSLAAPAYQFSEWIENWKENRTGFTRYSQGMDASALNKTATGISIVTQKADMRMELIARNFAVGVRKAFAKFLKLAVAHQDREEMIELSGDWVAINPSEFKDQFNVKIRVGLGTGTKEQTMQRAMALLEAQLKAGVPTGIVRPEQIAETIKLLVEANEFKQPERFVDMKPQNAPRPEQMQEMQQQLQQMQQENQQLKAQNESKQGDLQLKAAELELKKQELAGKQYEAEQRLQLGFADSARADAQVEQPEAIAQLAQQVEMLTEIVMQLAQPPQLEMPPEPDALQMEPMEQPEPPQGGFSLGDDAL
ncbi:hypothetical protein V3390_09220 [Luteimonas sp. FXH3W]|uniref:Portal protein n=1 Tax=Aquilutibacter rugosus TaxID=3115820 RepID=A0ABU7V0U7_9GAMM